MNRFHLFSMPRKKMYDKNDPKQKLLRYKLAFMLATSSVPTSIVENAEFLDYVNTLDPKHDVPKRQAETEDIAHLYERGKAIVKKMLGNSFKLKQYRPISIS